MKELAHSIVEAEIVGLAGNSEGIDVKVLRQNFFLFFFLHREGGNSAVVFNAFNRLNEAHHAFAGRFLYLKRTGGKG